MRSSGVEEGCDGCDGCDDGGGVGAAACSCSAAGPVAADGCVAGACLPFPSFPFTHRRMRGKRLTMVAGCSGDFGFRLGDAPRWVVWSKAVV